MLSEYIKYSKFNTAGRLSWGNPIPQGKCIHGLAVFFIGDNMKLCECGCGQPTKIIRRTHKKQGLIKGKYLRFIIGHWLKTSRICNVEGCKEKHWGNGLCQKHYYLKNKEHVLKITKKYREEHKKQIKQYRQEHKEQRKQYYQEHKERIAEYSKQYYNAHKEEIDKYSRRNYNEHKEHYLKIGKQYRQNNKEYYKKHQRQYRKTLIGKAGMKVDAHNRRTLLKGLTKETVQRVYEANIEKYGVLTCYLCFKPITDNNDSLDHSTPITRKGSNDFENLGIAHGICNSKKGTKTLKEWNYKK